MTTFIRITIISLLVAAFAATSNESLAQCPNSLPQSVINSIQTPEVRQAATINTWLDPATIQQYGGLPNMIQLSRKQIEADRATVAEEQQHQAYLAQNGMANDPRAVDGRKVIQMLTESQRLTQAAIEVMECHSRVGSMPGASPVTAIPVDSTPAATFPGPAGTPEFNREMGFAGQAPTGMTAQPRDMWSLPAAERQSALAREVQSAVPREPGADLSRALDGITQQLRKRAMANASPEMAAFLAKQDAIQANAQANMAASEAGRRAGQVSAQRDSMDKQVQMVTAAVTSWQPPRSYSAASSINAGAIEDPFANKLAVRDNTESIVAALGRSGLLWDESRRVARVGAGVTSLCGGRLRDGDYPVLPDGNLLDSAVRIVQFQSSCSDASYPIIVVRESGNVEVRR